ncbi:MAG: hypothetical protein CVV27_14055 [Candidatus Melainabacteria bacterium HGW-Melainabacteria-1]|nr:MAG: hypothetical protein CVV27_14055 [Candidatus Melainabacteria bacterium HGW-Melainabacteria-1]
METESEFFAKIAELASASAHIARQAEQAYTPEVEALIQAKIRDPHHIERLLDGILDFCFDPAMLSLFKRLCRYYFKIDPVATASYVQSYREMWDEAESSNCS